ncbi:hypothetical protein F5J12DRAFT_779568 [Pisolithus orientalis]|uniref:uncharacterized protein n=1 Tax=Pisolithus orientalis TaxID=936130 RepID=UPI00222466C3|nr:uncharacterized protein F5J12DRAFT_779568 [Pisolithus orientalis]KAI6030406.1 hypothetical protein F5J12DRAFT_779568 [Pisolithus orientalis]
MPATRLSAVTFKVGPPVGAQRSKRVTAIPKPYLKNTGQSTSPMSAYVYASQAPSLKASGMSHDSFRGHCGMSHDSFRGYCGTSHSLLWRPLGCPMIASEATMGHPTLLPGD